MSISKISVYYTTDELYLNLNQSQLNLIQSQSKFHQLCFQSLSAQFPTAYSFSFYFEPADNPAKHNHCALLKSTYNSSNNTITSEWITRGNDYDLDTANTIIADIIQAQLWLIKK